MNSSANWLVTILLGTSVLTACGAASEPQATQPVELQVAASAGPTAAPGASALQLGSFRMVIGPVGLGHGDQFGCIDCEDNDAEDSDVETQQLLDVPLDGTPVVVATEQASPGTYPEAELSIERPRAATVATASAWPDGATMVISGTFEGRPFELPLAVEGSFRETLDPPVSVSATAQPEPVAVIITLPVASWFEADGVVLDPTDPQQVARITANVRNSLEPDDDEGAEGEAGNG